MLPFWRPINRKDDRNIRYNGFGNDNQGQIVNVNHWHNRQEIKYPKYDASCPTTNRQEIVCTFCKEYYANSGELCTYPTYYITLNLPVRDCAFSTSQQAVHSHPIFF